MDIKAITSLRRFREILMTSMKYGFDDLIERLELPGGIIYKKISHIDKKLSPYERVRLALQELGPTFIKFGQILSLRPDLLPAGMLEELCKLQDDVAAVPSEKIVQIIEKSSGKPLEQTFSVFDKEPLATASISQVHKGVLQSNGKIVSIKVQRPGIASKMKKDLDILSFFANRLHERIEEYRDFDLPNLVKTIRRSLLRELDFNREARNMKIARGYAEKNENVMIPKVYEEDSTAGVLVMEFVPGTTFSKLQTQEVNDSETLAKRGLHIAIDQILKDGFFHADPHPGNLLVTQDNRICLIDWGTTGRLSQRDRHELISFLSSMLDQDGEAMVHSLLRIATTQHDIDERGLERELLDIVDFHYAVSIEDMDIGRLLLDIADALRRFRLHLPPNLVIMIKALVTAEGTARALYPKLDVIAEAQTQIKDLSLKRYTPEAVWRNLHFTISQIFNYQKIIPLRLKNIIDKVDQGNLSIGFYHENLEDFMNVLDSITNRLAFAIIIAAMIIGSSMIITTGVRPFVFGFPAMGVIGYTISGILGLWLLFNIIKGRKY